MLWGLKFLNRGTTDTSGQMSFGCGGLACALQGVQQRPWPLPRLS